jgi:energy-coupling factor transporter ATP-binding protein EcfA2
VLRALAGFGLTVEDVEGVRAGIVGAAREGAGRVVGRLEAAGTVVLVTGASGSGKSTLLGEVVRELRERGRAVVDGREIARRVMGRAGARVVDLVGDGEAGLRALSMAGLADARVPPARVGELSEGQRARLVIAVAALERGGTECRGVESGSESRGTRSTLVLDEFCSTLDDATARGVCLSLRRWAKASGAAVVVATAREAVRGWLRPDIVVDTATLGSAGGVGIIEAARAGAGDARGDGDDGGLEIAEGSPGDYLALAHHHYRGGAPATVARVLVARERGGGTAGAAGPSLPLGVLVVSLPTLNGSWRAQAWPGEYAGDRAGVARRLNAEVRCVSRVIVRPEARGRGVGAALVRAYLARPLTRRTEAVAAMGAASPMFARAGMAEWTPPRSARDERLIGALEAAGLRPWELAWPSGVMERAAAWPPLEVELRRWARASRGTRRAAEDELAAVIRAAARRVPVRARAYTQG